MEFNWNGKFTGMAILQKWGIILEWQVFKVFKDVMKVVFKAHQDLANKKKSLRYSYYYELKSR